MLPRQFVLGITLMILASCTILVWILYGHFGVSAVRVTSIVGIVMVAQMISAVYAYRTWIGQNRKNTDPSSPVRPTVAGQLDIMLYLAGSADLVGDTSNWTWVPP